MSQAVSSKVGRGSSVRWTGQSLVVALLLLGGAASSAAQGAEEAAMPLPLVDRAISTPAAARLRSGFRAAVRRVREVPQCRALILGLGADPESLFSRLDFRAAPPQSEGAYCRRGVVALTKVGQPVIWVCREFARVKLDEAAMLVIHETLHIAGLRERPSTPDAMSSQEINSLVSSSCGF